MFAAALVTAVVVVAASVYVWIDLGGGAMYGEVSVEEAEFHLLSSASQAEERFELTSIGLVKSEAQNQFGIVEAG